jgi:hypothetical protein
MRQSPRDFLFDALLVPVRMCGSQMHRQHLLSRLPEANANSDSLRRRFSAQYLSHDVVNDLNLSVV